MNDNEVTKIIAEFMGWKYCARHSPSPVFTHEKYSEKYEYENYFKYTESLDALIPVWEKARISNVCQFDFNRIGDNYEFLIFQDRPDKDYGNSWHAKEHTLQQAAAHATAKAIKDLT